MRLLTDGTGTITDSYTYDAFGNLINSTGSTPNEYLYAGERLDAGTGFYYLRARYMNPASGRFWSMDSYEGSATDPTSLHKYMYVGANPTNKIDPTGHLEGDLASFNVTFSIGETLASEAALTLGTVETSIAAEFAGETAIASTTTAGGTSTLSAIAFLSSFTIGAAIANSGGDSKNEDDYEIFYRSMSYADFDSLKSSGQVPIHGESFVTRSLEQQVITWLTSSLKYDVFVIFLMQKGTEATLIQNGAVSNSALQVDPSLSRLPYIGDVPKSRAQSVVHIKGEHGALTFGLRSQSAAFFNNGIRAFVGIPLQ